MSKPLQPESTDHVPADNLPGHHPEHEQDKPDVKVAAVPRGVRDVSLDDFRAPEETIAGEALRAAAGAVRKVREALPGD